MLFGGQLFHKTVCTAFWRKRKEKTMLFSVLVEKEYLCFLLAYVDRKRGEGGQPFTIDRCMTSACLPICINQWCQLSHKKGPESNARLHKWVIQIIT